MSWVEEEFAKINIGDKRLNNRLFSNNKCNIKNIEGPIFHAALAVTTTGIPLGMQSVKIWARDGEINEGWSESFSY